MKVKVEYDYCDEYTGCDPTSCTMELPDDIDINDKEALLRWLDEEFPAEGTNGDGLDCNYIDPAIILDGKVICKRDDGELSGVYEGKRLSENTKVTLTFKQLKRLVKESEDDGGTFDDNAKLLQKEIEKVIADKARSWEKAGAVLPFGMERNLARAILEHLYLDWSFKPLSGIPNHTPAYLDETAKRPNRRIKSRGNPN